MFTPQGLLAFAAEQEELYQELLKKYPPGTVNDERNEAHRKSDEALICAAWMEKNGYAELKHVGSFASFKPKRGDIVLIPKGTRIRSLNPAERGQEKRAGKSYTVEVFDHYPGWVDVVRQVVHQPVVNWAGAGGYWQSADMNDITPVEK